MRKELKKLLVGMIRKAVREVVREEIGKRKVTHITIDHLIGQLSLSTVANEQPTLLETPQKGDPGTIQVEKRH